MAEDIILIEELRLESDFKGDQPQDIPKLNPLLLDHPSFILMHLDI